MLNVHYVHLWVLRILYVLYSLWNKYRSLFLTFFYILCFPLFLMFILASCTCGSLLRYVFPPHSVSWLLFFPSSSEDFKGLHHSLSYLQGVGYILVWLIYCWPVSPSLLSPPFYPSCIFFGKEETDNWIQAGSQVKEKDGGETEDIHTIGTAGQERARAHGSTWESSSFKRV